MQPRDLTGSTREMAPATAAMGLSFNVITTSRFCSPLQTRQEGRGRVWAMMMMSDDVEGRERVPEQELHKESS